MPDDIKTLMAAAERAPKMTADQREQQARSFAYGNAAIENPYVTREMVARHADQVKAGKR